MKWTYSMTMEGKYVFTLLIYRPKLTNVPVRLYSGTTALNCMSCFVADFLYQIIKII